MSRLDGKVAVITGGASGMGEGTVRRFVDEGARVVIADIQDAKGHTLADTLGGAAVYQPTDGSDMADYNVSSEALVPEAQVLYALSAEGEFPHTLRFQAKEAGVVALSELVSDCLAIAGGAVAARSFATLFSRNLTGCGRSPREGQVAATGGIFLQGRGVAASRLSLSSSGRRSPWRRPRDRRRDRR